MDTERSDEPENDSFETIAPEKDNPVEREFEIGQLGNEAIKGILARLVKSPMMTNTPQMISKVPTNPLKIPDSAVLFFQISLRLYPLQNKNF